MASPDRATADSLATAAAAEREAASELPVTTERPPSRAAAASAARLAAWLETARRSGFRALVALIERLSPGTARVGEAGPAELEPIRFHHHPALVFSNADVTSVVGEDLSALDTAERPGRRYHVTTTFLGLSGGVSPLPDHFSDELAVEDADAPVRSRFFDLFHHRVLSLLYRGQSKFDYPNEYEPGGTDRWSRRVAALLGVDAFAADRPAGDIARLLRLAPLLMGSSRGPQVLRAAVEDDLLPELGSAAGVAVRELVGSWIDLEPGDRPILGAPSMCLGRNAVLGGRIFDLTAKFRVVLGPVPYQAMRRLLPGGDLNERLARIVGLVTARPGECDAEIIVGAGEAPGVRLSRGARQGLGRDTWLGRRAGEEKRVVVPVG
jgi:type VI secretion system protein ImpH